ncbi:MAG: stalk domain-containing protein, partial [Candidatus Lustribacter sp.]
MRSLAGAAAVAFALLLGRAAGAQVGITINGNGVDVSPSPFVQAGRVFVPLRGVFQRLGAQVVYSNGHINATDRDRDVSLNIGSTQATVDGQPETIDDAPFIIGASTYVPLRFVSQALGAGVTWDGNDRIVEISMPGAPEYQAETQQNDEDGDWVDAPPPPIPYYELPAVQDPNEIWIPGYWAWGEAGYYWVPGFWAEPPQTGYYWTPGYWAANAGAYSWHQGYWGLSVG